jgi:hypothetical protein
MKCKTCQQDIPIDINCNIWDLKKDDVMEYFGRAGDCMLIMKDKRIICECDCSLSTIDGNKLIEDGGEFVSRNINDEYSNLGEQYDFEAYSEYLGRWMYRRVSEDTNEIEMGIHPAKYKGGLNPYNPNTYFATGKIISLGSIRPDCNSRFSYYMGVDLEGLIIKIGGKENQLKISLAQYNNLKEMPWSSLYFKFEIVEDTLINAVEINKEEKNDYVRTFVGTVNKVSQHGGQHTAGSEYTAEIELAQLNLGNQITQHGGRKDIIIDENFFRYFDEPNSFHSTYQFNIDVSNNKLVSYGKYKGDE